VRQSAAVLDLGVTRSLLSQLADLGCAVRILPPTATPKDVHAASPGAVIIAGGPGDPRTLGSAILTIKNLLGGVRILGIGLGHQVLALALGCGIARMKLGHHGVNYPVRDLVRHRCAITAQHHSFMVDVDAVPDGVEVTHVNVNDRTVEGICSLAFPAASVQFHPARDEMGRPSAILQEFVTGAR
jgi:carbamoyl-phosphate synthase small subunit